MDGVGTGGVVFIWIGFLWPFIVSSAYLVISKPSRAGKYFLVSTAIGYVIMIGLNMVFVAIARNTTDVSKTESVPFIVWIGLSLMFLLPAVSGHFLSRKYK